MKYKTDAWEQQLYKLPQEIEIEDELLPLIDGMLADARSNQYEKANEKLDKIKELLKTTPLMSSPYNPGREHCRTLLSVHDKIRNHSIRLDWTRMDLSKYLILLKKIHRIINENNIKTNVDNMRKVTAQCMVELELAPQEGKGRKAPNRAFMDVLYRIKPTYATPDLKRREQTKLKNAVKTGNRKDIEEAKFALREIREKELCE